MITHYAFICSYCKCVFMSRSKIIIIDWDKIYCSTPRQRMIRRSFYDVLKAEKEEIREGEGKRLENESRREISSGYKLDFKKP